MILERYVDVIEERNSGGGKIDLRSEEDSIVRLRKFSKVCVSKCVG